MKLTKEQKHFLYIIWLEEWECSWHFDPFLCNTMSFVFGITPTEEMFPELFKIKPKKNHFNGGWFSNNSIIKRRNILKKCIQETADI